MLLTRKLSALRPVFIVICVAMIYGCSTSGIQTSTGEQATNVVAVFESGEARLNCEVSCSGAWGSSRLQAKMLYDQGLWRDLAIEVAQVGFKADQTYFYLGRAAEGLGHAEAARTYYKLGLASSYKCAGIFNNCDGLIFPSEILAGINRLPSPTKAAAPVVASASVLVVPTANTPIVKKVQEESPPAHVQVPIAKVEATNANFRSTVEIKYDEFKKLTRYESPMIFDGEGEGGIILRAWKPEISPMIFQIYVNAHYIDEWRFYKTAWDSDGIQLETVLISRDVGFCGGGTCARDEILGLNVTQAYLEKHRQTGVRFKLSGQAGEDIFSISAAHIDAFLEVVK